MSRTLPPRPSLEQIRNQAKDLLRIHRSGDASCCRTLRLLHRLKVASDADVLAAGMRLDDCQFALAMDYGFTDWNELRQNILTAMRDKEQDAMKETEWLPLFDGTNLSKWGIGGLDNMEIEGDTLVIREKPVKAEVGGASWDNYVISADVMIERKTSEGSYCVQLTGDGTQIHCQLVPGAVVFGYWSDEPRGDPKGFTHFGKREFHVPEGEWFNFQMKAEHNSITAVINDIAILTAECPRDTDGGFPGFVVNQLKQSEVRMKNIRIKFLEPTEEQLQEYETDASYNWLKCKASDGTGQRSDGAATS